MAYKAELPAGVTLPEGHRIDVSDGRYKQLEALATSQKWTQAAFSSVLGIEAGRVSAAHASARAAPVAAAPAPAARAAIPANWGTMSFGEKTAWAFANPKRG
jgi:hypothetical protein